MKRIRTLVSIPGALALSHCGPGYSNAQRDAGIGALVGGAAGAAVGYAIGHEKDERRC